MHTFFMLCGEMIEITKELNIPYVFKALILDDVEKIGELIVCQDGEN